MDNKNGIKDADELLEKLGAFKMNSADLSSGEDLSLAVMNLISIEEHLYFTAMKTDKGKYLDLLGAVRAVRSRLLRELIKQPEGELWCVSKHLLATTMRLIEVGTKYLAESKKKEAVEKFDQAFDLYSIFWSLNLEGGVSAKHATEPVEDRLKQNTFGGMREMVKKIIDCCKE